jgi:CrcB protein
VARLLLIVAAGGALGSAARFAASTWALRVFGGGFPVGTLVVNAAGSFLLGAILGALPAGAAPEWRLFLGAGVMGGFTTYSSFNHETLALLEQGRAGAAAASVAVTLLGCLAVGAAGLALGRALAAA